MTNWNATAERPYEKAGDRLDAWCQKLPRGTPRHTVAKQLGVSPQAFSRYVTGRGRPDLLIALHLQTITNGKVPARLWYADECSAARKLGFDLFAEV